MMKQLTFLFVMLEAGGNVPPMFHLAKTIMGRGHKVAILSEPCMEQPVRELGAEYIPFTEHFLRTDRKEDLTKDWNATPFKNPAFDNVIFGPAKTVVKQTIHAIEQLQADVLVVDIMLFPAVIAADYCNIPKALIFHMPEYMPGPNRPPGNMGLLPGKGVLGKVRDRLLGKIMNIVFDKYKPMFNEIRQSLGLPLLNRTVDLLNNADWRLIQTLRSFDFPIEPAPQNVRYTGPVLDDPDWLTTWDNPWTEVDERPLVVIAFSTTFQNQMAAIQNCAEALQGLNVRGLITLGYALQDEQLTVPDNVKLVQSAPHSLVFPNADLVITHAGHGTVIRALANGVPMVCMPMGRDQNDNAAKVVYHGCGITLNKKALPGKIKRAVQTVLSDSKYKDNAVRFKHQVRAGAGQEEAVILEMEQEAAKTGKAVLDSITV